MPNKLIDLTGKRFGKLSVIERAKENIHDRPAWVCKCDCGKTAIVFGTSLRNGNTKSCGCLLGFRSVYGEKAPELTKSHKNMIYHAWSEMIRRCTKDNVSQREYYKGKGISVCDSWLSFDDFAKWALANGYEKGLEIDRIDGDKDYSPENCRWVTHKKNSRNRKARSNNTTGYPGVHTRTYSSGRVVYRVSIATDAGKVNVGTFYDLDSAIAARKEAELKYWGFNIGE